MLKYAIGLLVLLGAIPAAQAQSGGYSIYTPPALGSGSLSGSTTYVTPNGGGGYTAYTPPALGSGSLSGTTTYINPN